jgi:hypothetical protein
VLVCDRDLACALAKLGLLRRADGSAWLPQRRFVDGIGERVRCFDRPALICPHPVLLCGPFSQVYRDRIKEIGLGPLITDLAKTALPADDSGWQAAPARNALSLSALPGAKRYNLRNGA